MAWAISTGSPFTVLHDSCVLHPAPLRDLLLELGLTDLFRARWTDRIHEEWIRALLRNRPDLSRARLERTRELMNSQVRDCLVTGVEPIVPVLDLPDPDDRHVLAAAIVGRADLILTFNLDDFPPSSLAWYRIEARHPDDFLVNLLDVDEAKVLAAVRTCRRRLLHPPKTAEEYLNILARQTLPVAVRRLRERAERL